MFLIHPPVVKPCEPPAGIGKLYGALWSHGLSCRLLDANLEGILSFLHHQKPPMDPWGARAFRHVSNHLDLLRSWKGYHSMDRYKRAIADLNHLLESETKQVGIRLSLSDYEDREHSPVKSSDLLQSAELPERNPFYPYFRQRFLDLFEREAPPSVGFSINYLGQALSTFAMAGFLKRTWPNLKILLGGGLINSWMKRPAWKNPFGGLVDELIPGPGVAPLLSWMGVKGPAIKKHTLPRYDEFSLRDYLAPGTILPYSASSGCYWNQCAFCPERAEGNAYLPVSAERVVKDLQTLAEALTPALIHLLDNAISPALMGRLIDQPPGVSWYGFARITPQLSDLDFCMALKESGCVMLQLGIESGDQAVLDGLRKGIDLREASKALRNLRKADIGTFVYLLFGTPEEGPKEARKTLDFVVTHHREISFLNLALFNLPLDDKEAPQIETRDFYRGDLSLYTDFEHPKGWDRKRVRQFLDKEFRRHPAIGSILRRTPPLFTSNHAPFFLMKGMAKRGPR